MEKKYFLSLSNKSKVENFLIQKYRKSPNSILPLIQKIYIYIYINIYVSSMYRKIRKRYLGNAFNRQIFGGDSMYVFMQKTFQYLSKYVSIIYVPSFCKENS